LDNPQSLNLYGYVRNNPLSSADIDGHDVNVCLNDASGNSHCTQMSNEQYQVASQGNGSLNVPTLDQVGMNGNGNGSFNSTNITDSSGNSLGTATYVSDGGADYYANRNGINALGQTGATMNDPRTYAAWFGASGLVGGAMVATGAIGGSALTTLSGENGVGLVTNQAINRMIGTVQRELLKDFFKTGRIPEGLSQRTLQLYKEIAERAIAAGKDQLGVQAQRLQQITSALK
jgi:hypothetical protein